MNKKRLLMIFIGYLAFPECGIEPYSKEPKRYRIK